MKGAPAIYLGRIVDKKNFRVFIYGVNGEKKLVESWDEFEAAMQSGIWFSSKELTELKNESQEEIENVIPTHDQKPKIKKKSKKKNEGEIAPTELDRMVFEVKDGE